MNKDESVSLKNEMINSELKHNLLGEDELVSDLENAELLDDLSLLSRIKYNSNQFGIGNFITLVDFSDDKAYIISKLGDETIKEVSVDKEKFLDKLDKLEIKNWKRYYVSEDSEGNLWHLNLYFNDDKDLIKVGGNNLFPENYKKLHKLLKIPKRKFPKVIF